MAGSSPASGCKFHNYSLPNRNTAGSLGGHSIITSEVALSQSRLDLSLTADSSITRIPGTAAKTAQSRRSLHLARGSRTASRIKLNHFSCANNDALGMLGCSPTVSFCATSPQHCLCLFPPAGPRIRMPVHSMVWLKGGVGREPLVLTHVH